MDQQKESMTADRSDVLQGTLELLVLRTLALRPMHGWGLAQRIETMSGDVFASSRARCTRCSSA